MHVAGAVIDGQDVIFGGGGTSSHDQVQSLAPGPDKPTAVTIAHLPDAQSDCVAVSIGSTVYIVGGFNGSSSDPTVLATTDGRGFRNAATLPVSVRYPAVTALDGRNLCDRRRSGRRPGQRQGCTRHPDRRPVDRIRECARDDAPAARRRLRRDDRRAHHVAGGTIASSDTATGGSSTPSIWALDPLDGKILRAGTLRVPVSNAGIAVIGTTAWLIGGETEGTVTAAVQTFRPTRDWDPPWQRQMALCNRIRSARESRNGGPKMLSRRQPVSINLCGGASWLRRRLTTWTCLFSTRRDSIGQGRYEQRPKRAGAIGLLALLFGFSVIRYQDAVACLRDRRFHSALSLIPVRLPAWNLVDTLTVGVESILSMEGRRPRLRRLVAPTFTPAAAAVSDRSCRGS